MPEQDGPRVEFDELLAAEFNYIAQTAMQANEDRARVSSFYLIAVGSLGAAVFGTQYVDPQLFDIDADLVFGILFILLTLLGSSTIMQLARLRAAWYESALAMNELKNYMIRYDPSLEKAFRWKAQTLPEKYKKNSVSYYQAVEVALISGLMAGAAIFFLQRALAPPIGVLDWMVTGVLAVGTVFLQLHLYRRALQ